MAGKEIDHALIDSLPADVDVCGENGEFHTFAFKGPIFLKEVKYKTGVKVFKTYKAPTKADDNCVINTDEPVLGFWYGDLLPA